MTRSNLLAFFISVFASDFILSLQFSPLWWWVGLVGGDDLRAGIRITINPGNPITWKRYK